MDWLFDTGLWVVMAWVLFGVLVYSRTQKGNSSLPSAAPDWDWPLAPDLQARRGVSHQSREYARKT